jgi:hypothetical protein
MSGTIIPTPTTHPPTIGGNRLAVLAAEIQEAHADTLKYLHRAAERALEAGKLLLEAKELLGHGQFLPWIKENCQLSERTAQRYMRIARSGVEPAKLADLGIAAVDKALALPGPDGAEPEPELPEGDLDAEQLATIIPPLSTGGLQSAWIACSQKERIEFLHELREERNARRSADRAEKERFLADQMNKASAAREACLREHGAIPPRPADPTVPYIEGWMGDFPIWCCPPGSEKWGGRPGWSQWGAEMPLGPYWLNLEDPDFPEAMRARGCRGTYSPTGATFPEDLTYKEWVHIGRVLRMMPGIPTEAPICRDYLDEGMRRAKAAPFRPEKGHFKSKQEFLGLLAVDAAAVQFRGTLMRPPGTIDDNGVREYDQIEPPEWWNNKEAIKSEDYAD